MLLAGAAAVQTRAQPAFDHGYAAWDALLKRHVQWLPDGKQSRVDYDGFAADHAAVQRVLEPLSGVSPADFDAWTRERQIAFLVNAYNAFTIELVLARWPHLRSIRDLGGFLQTAWQRKFFRLLGEQRHLDWIEHEQLRPRYREPRIHAAIVCASIGCPALRPQAFTESRLEAQLEDGLQRFLGDRTRNRVRNGRLEVSPIFKWFRADFEKGDAGFTKLADVFARHAERLTDVDAERELLRRGALAPVFLDYDWSLNAKGR
jgi:hypothetical protein